MASDTPVVPLNNDKQALNDGSLVEQTQKNLTTDAQGTITAAEPLSSTVGKDLKQEGSTTPTEEPQPGVESNNTDSATTSQPVDSGTSATIQPAGNVIALASVQQPVQEVAADLSLPEPLSWPGPYLRLNPIRLDKLPDHPDLVKENTKEQNEVITRPDLRNFILEVLAEADHVVKKQIPQWHKKSPKTYKEVEASIDLFEKEIHADEILKSNKEGPASIVRDWKDYPQSPEYWYARSSTHKNQKDSRTATWDEFVSGLRDDHSENEMDYTKSIYDARLIIDYTQQLKAAGLTNEIGGLTMRIFEMAHETPATNRVFATCVLTASISKDEFLVAQLPVDLKDFGGAFYSNGKHKAKDAKLSNSKMKADVVIGAYTSVEYCQRSSDVSDGKSKTQWVMATASAAKGLIPQVFQNLAIPGTIAKDVKFFVTWVEKRR